MTTDNNAPEYVEEMRLTLITAGETCWSGTPDQAFIVTTRGGRQVYNSAKREDAVKFINRYKRNNK
jgi:hypothetical protein